MLRFSVVTTMMEGSCFLAPYPPQLACSVEACAGAAENYLGYANDDFRQKSGSHMIQDQDHGAMQDQRGYCRVVIAALLDGRLTLGRPSKKGYGRPRMRSRIFRYLFCKTRKWT